MAKQPSLAEKQTIQNKCMEKFSFEKFELAIKNLLLTTVNDY
jgi:hypothetical protein